MANKVVNKNVSKNKQPKKKLTPKQKKFIEEYMKTNNATEAASKVYNVKNKNVAGNIWCDNLKKPNIKDKLTELWVLAELIYEEVLTQWTALWKEAKTWDIIDVATKCHDKAYGKAVQKIEQTNINFNKDVDDLTDEEIDQLLNE